MKEKEDVYKHVKRILIENKTEYPERALYENYLKFNADYYFKPKDCRLSLGSFGISVFPNIYNPEVHSGLKLITFFDNKVHTEGFYLPHQIYLHELVLRLWQSEIDSKKCTFEIHCIRKVDEIVKIN